MARKPKNVIHPAVKQAFGYDAGEPDGDMLADWEARTSRVCKPCWELKYCPYGPLVEQAPVIPSVLAQKMKQISYFRRCLETNLVGSVGELTDQSRQKYEKWIADDQLLLRQARYQLRQRAKLDSASSGSTDQEKIDRWLRTPSPPARTAGTAGGSEDAEISEGDCPPEVWKALRAEADAIRQKYCDALKSGQIDDRSPLEPARRAWFQKVVDAFDPSDYPPSVPEILAIGECNVFGHVCPVFSAAGAPEGTSAERRHGRFISCSVKTRVVRRDNYACRHCGKRLKDDEVEFDHIVPVCEGGTSEEENVWLSCFGCSRDKSAGRIA